MNVGAVFGIIFALVVLGFVLILGSGQITNLVCIGSLSTTNKDIMNLETVINDLQASGEGSSDTYRVDIASNARLCFIDPQDPRPHISGEWTPDYDLYPVIEKDIQTGNHNVWIEYNCGQNDPGYRIDNLITPEDGYQGNFCVRAGDELLLTNVPVQTGGSYTTRVKVERIG